MKKLNYSTTTHDLQSEIDPVQYKKCMKFLVNPPKDLMIKKKGFNAVKAIRELRD